MTAVDNETGYNLINPYIEISRNSEVSCFINTSTFGDLQESLIHALDDERLQPLLRSQSSLYNINAVVREYNWAIPGENPLGLIIRTVSVCRPERSRTFLGYLEESLIKEKLPNCFRVLN